LCAEIQNDDNESTQPTQWKSDFKTKFKARCHCGHGAWGSPRLEVAVKTPKAIRFVGFFVQQSRMVKTLFHLRTKGTKSTHQQVS